MRLESTLCVNLYAVKRYFTPKWFRINLSRRDFLALGHRERRIGLAHTRAA